jgi:hypothetical protein
MALQVFDKVVASRDIRRYRTVVAKTGSMGIIVDAQVTPSAVSYTVQFRLPTVSCGVVNVPRVCMDDVCSAGTTGNQSRRLVIDPNRASSAT